MSMPEASGSTCPLHTACGTYTWPSMQHSLNSMLFSVSVPVLSVKMYSTCGHTAALGAAGRGRRRGGEEAPLAGQPQRGPASAEGASRAPPRSLPGQPASSSSRLGQRSPRSQGSAFLGREGPWAWGWKRWVLLGLPCLDTQAWGRE